MARGPVMGPRGMIGTVRGSPFVPRSPFVRGGVVRGGPFVSGGFGHGGPFFRGGAFVPGRFAAAPVRFFHPYYAFRPHLHVGFGLWAGYPFAYSSPFYSPYYSYNVYTSPVESPYDAIAPSTASGSVEAQPAQTNMGGLSFDVTPSTAELFVDKMLVGTVGQFTSMTEPLGLEAGSHHIELSAPGYQMLSFDVDIVAGEVIPYQGTLER
jgi:hypothetical protein